MVAVAAVDNEKQVRSLSFTVVIPYVRECECVVARSARIGESETFIAATDRSKHTNVHGLLFLSLAMCAWCRHRRRTSRWCLHKKNLVLH